jgi:hypothetical protein
LLDQDEDRVGLEETGQIPEGRKLSPPPDTDRVGGTERDDDSAVYVRRQRIAARGVFGLWDLLRQKAGGKKKGDEGAKEAGSHVEKDLVTGLPPQGFEVREASLTKEPERSINMHMTSSRPLHLSAITLRLNAGGATCACMCMCACMVNPPRDPF